MGSMGRNTHSTILARPPAKEKLVPMSAIRKLAREIVAKFHPERIILFGSYAYGKPHRDSDVDILVVMPTRNELDQSAKICIALDYHFGLDLVVRKPENLRRRLQWGDWFLREIVNQGKVLYEKTDATIHSQGRGRQTRRRHPDAESPKCA